MPRARRQARPAKPQEAESYKHPDATSPMRPDVGTQAQFRKRKPPQKYRYDDSLSPALDWDGQNPAREAGERQLAAIEEELSLVRRQLSVAKPSDADVKAAAEAARKASEATEKLKALSKPFLNWAGKAERLSFDVPTLPLFVHERLSTKAIIETLTAHRRERHPGQLGMFELFGDPQHSVTDQVLRAYEYADKWVNRMILGDSLVVMNSLLHYEGLGGQVQMIYMDPPYGVKFGSNFQPFVRKRDVSHNDDEDMTREPEMVQAYRDTWELGLHSYLTYLRDRLLLARDLLAPSGSIFVQISDENVHHVRELMDDVFKNENFGSQITFQKTSGSTTRTVPTTSDYLLWYAGDIERLKFRKLYQRQFAGAAGAVEYKRVELSDGSLAPIGQFEHDGKISLPTGARIFATDSIVSKGGDDPDIDLEWEGRKFRLSCKPNRHWKPGVQGIRKLWDENRLLRQEGLRIYKRYIEDFPYRELVHVWSDTRGEDEPDYVVQTHTKVLERCILMATDPGDLVLDPTCGSGTTPNVAEQWGRRWITIDTSRVPLALARQRLLTATFPWYQLKDEKRGPAAGFVYVRKRNNKGEEVGGIVPHVTLKSIANNEPPEEEVLVDRPEKDDGITRVSGAFCVEGTIPTPVGMIEEDRPDADSGLQMANSGSRAGAHSGSPTADSRRKSITDSTGDNGTFVDRMLEILRKSPVLRLAGNSTVTLRNIRPPAKTLSLSAEALVDATAPGQKASLAEAVQEAAEKTGNMLALSAKPVALVFGPENGAVSEKLVYEAAREARAKNYTHLYVIGFAIQPTARQLVENCEAVTDIPATYVQATPDLTMGDLLKNMRSSQIFSVCGLPEIEVRKAKADSSATPRNDNPLFEVELLGLDVFDPVTMKNVHRNANDVPAWFLDTDYNGLCFHVSQAFFPRTGAWESLKKALKGEYEESVWDHLSGTMSAPFEAGEQGQIAVKVIDDRGNELMVVEKLG